MDWLNYHHLLYFWSVAKEGSISRAADALHLSQPTVSTQISKLEKAMGVSLFDRRGRNLVLTDTGQTVYRYADEIFSLGREMVDAVQGQASEQTIRLMVGVPDVLPKLIVYQLLKPALQLDEKVKLICHEGKLNDLLSDLALHRLDIVLADSPLTSQINVRAFNHLLGQCCVTVFGTPKLARKFKNGFPQSLSGAPMLLPTQTTMLRRSLDQWFDEHDIHPEVAHEFEDSAVLKVFGQEGEGLVVVPSAMEKEVERQYSLKPIGRIEEIVERFYAISIERRLKHPAVVAISQAAKEDLFGSSS